MAHRNRWFTYYKLVDLSMAMLNNQMVCCVFFHINQGLQHTNMV